MPDVERTLALNFDYSFTHHLIRYLKPQLPGNATRTVGKSKVNEHEANMLAIISRIKLMRFDAWG